MLIFGFSRDNQSKIWEANQLIGTFCEQGGSIVEPHLLKTTAVTERSERLRVSGTLIANDWSALGFSQFSHNFTLDSTFHLLAVDE
jgi:hypothetical protein